jgi:hypothetical protein
MNFLSLTGKVNIAKKTDLGTYLRNVGKLQVILSLNQAIISLFRAIKKLEVQVSFLGHLDGSFVPAVSPTHTDMYGCWYGCMVYIRPVLWLFSRAVLSCFAASRYTHLNINKLLQLFVSHGRSLARGTHTG